MTRVGAQNGYILLPVVLFITLIATIAFLINNDSTINADMTVAAIEAEKGQQVAQAGLAHAMWGAQNSGCAGDMGMTTVPFGQAGSGSYDATVTTAGGTTTAYSLSADQDAWFRSDNITVNNGTTATYHLRKESGNLEYAVVRFDLSTLPAGAQINSATARFYIRATKGHPEGPVNLHRVTADWTETGATWETMASNFDSATLNTIPAQPDAGDVWVAVNLTAQVQAWVNGGESNYGIMLIPTGEGTHAEYISREGAANQQPRLDVIVGTGPATPMTITVTGTLTGNPSPANDITRTLTRSAVPAYQLPGIVTLQLGTDPGADTLIDAFYPRNYGGADYLQVNADPAWLQRALLKFDLGSIPAHAAVLSARLELGIMSVAAPGTATVHRVARSWVEGTQTGGGTADGASWATYDGTNNWTSAGGDFDASAVDETAIDPADTWVSWEIGPLVEQWLAGEPNDGLLIKADGALREAKFAARENTNLGVQPKLTITYACECGSACLAPQGSGNVLLVVGDKSTPDPEDAFKQSLLESWGYTVTMIDDGANQNAFDTEFVLNDVVYISETIDATILGSKLGNPPIGIVNEEGWKNDDLGFESANSSNWPVGNSIGITDTSHYITALFPTGPLMIYDADMGGLAIDNTPAPDLQSLADWGSDTGLAVLEAGAITAGGTPTAGRRVMLPFGRDINMDWPHVNSNGLLILQRALQWGTGNTGAPPRNLLLVTSGSSPTTQEQLRIDLIESWGYAVNIIDDDDSQANFDTAIAANDVAYIPQDINSTSLGTKMTNATIGVVNEEGEQVDELGFAQNPLFKDRMEIDILNSSHYITLPFTTGLLTFVSSNQSVHMLSSTQAPGLSTLAQSFNVGSQWQPSLAVIEVGGDLFGGGTAAGRRVELPWGGGTFDVAALNADGQTIMLRAIEWAEGAGSDLKVLLVVGDATTLGSKDVGYKALMESWGHTVTLIDDGDSQTNFDAAAAANDVIYVSGSSSGPSLLDKLTNTTTGMVNEVNGKIDNFGFSSSTSATANFDTFSTTSPTHYITEPFGGNPVTVFTSSLTNPVPGGTLAPDLQKVGFVSGTLALATLDTGATRYDSNPSPGRRAHLPFTVAETTDMTVDGKTILQRTLEWAAGADGTPSSCSADYVPDNKVSEFGPVSNIHGLTYFPAGKVFNGATAPADGAWVSIDQDGLISMTNLAGVELTSCTVSLGATSKTEGITFVESGTYANYLAVVIEKTSDSNIVYLQSDCTVSNTSVLSGIYNASGISYIGATVSGSYDGYLAIADYGTIDEVYIVDQAGVQAKVIDVTSVVNNLKSIVHLPGTDRLLLPNASAGQVGGIIDFVNYTGALNTYDMASLGADTPEGAAVNQLTCKHTLADTDTGIVITLDNLSGGGGGGPPTGGVVFEEFAEVNPSTTYNVNVPTPGGTVDGDLLIAAIASDEDASDLTAPAGWNPIVVQNNGTRVTLGVWWKIASASEPANHTFTSSSYNMKYGWMMRFSGHDPVNPINATSTFNTGSSRNPPVASTTTTVDNTLVLRVGGFDHEDITVDNPGLTGHTPITMDLGGSGLGACAGGAGYTSLPTAGATGTTSFALTAREQYVTGTIAIAPAP